MPCFIGSTDIISLGGAFNQKILSPFLQQVCITSLRLGQGKDGCRAVAAVGYSLRPVKSKTLCSSYHIVLIKINCGVAKEGWRHHLTYKAVITVVKVQLCFS